MILHSLRVAHWRSLLNSVELGPFSERLNVIHAPNGTGKSSLFEAMRRAPVRFAPCFWRGDRSGQAMGTVVSATSEVEFTQSGVRYRIEKTFLDGAVRALVPLREWCISTIG